MSNTINAAASATVATAGSVKGLRDATQSSTSTSGAVDATPAVDRVSLTGDAVKLQQLEKATSQNTGGDFDVKRVAATRAAIANGTYKVDSQAIASKLLGFESSLGGK